MRSSVRHARGALVVAGAASLLGLSPVRSVTADDVSAASTLTETVTAVDPATAPGDEVVATLDQVDRVVSGLAEEATTAADAEAEAAADLEAARAAVEQLEGGEAGDADADVPDATVAPPTGVLDGLSGRALAATTGRTALAGGQAAAGSSGALAPSQAGLAAADLAAEEAAARVEREAEEADEAATALAEAQAQGAEFVAGVEERVSTNLSEARAVATENPDEAESVQAEEQEIATSLEDIAAARERWAAAVAAAAADEGTATGAGTDAEAAEAGAEPEAAATPAEEQAAAERAAAETAAAEEQAAAERAAAERAAALNAPLPDPTGSASGVLAGAWCADGRRVVVDGSLGGAVQALINDAAAGGVGICAKSAFRPYAEQVELRRQNCGGSDYAIHQAPPSTCSPPTARPGTSNHEDGLAVDFSCDDGQPMTHASPCYRWLAAHAANYGLHNLPSEPWHWSVSGR